ncbi:MAG: lactate utilization protein [Bacillota bacterium]
MSGDLVEVFKKSASAASAEVKESRGLGELSAQIVCLARDHGLSSAVVGGGGLIERKVEEALREAGVEVLPVDKCSAAGAALGICCYEMGVADTGTLVADASTYDARLVSSLPPVHVAILNSDDLVPDMATALSRMYVRPRPPAYVAMVTGPSRTADIERELTLGVHGPGRLVIFLLLTRDGDGGACDGLQP